MTRAFLDGRLLVATGDITRVKADAIVNAANSALLGGGGVDGAIHRAGGPSIVAQCRTLRKERFPEGLPAGDAVDTTAGSLPARYVIHTVGPVWRGGAMGEERLLASCYTKSLEAAERLGLQSIVFPAISTGVYGYPREKAAQVAWKAISGWLSVHDTPRTVTLIFFSEDDARVFLAASGAVP